ncbi:MAG: FO synthase [Candidatus Azotimanducaceae bacterium]|jgi:FO synthase
MNETITRAAGASHGQETSPEEMERIISSLGRRPRQRTTNYGQVTDEQHQRALGAQELTEPEYTSAKKYERTRPAGKRDLYRPGLNQAGSELATNDNQGTASRRQGRDEDDRISSADII